MVVLTPAACCQFILQDRQRCSGIASLTLAANAHGSHADAVIAAPFTNVSRSALIVSASVVGMPCGKPL